MLTMKEINLKDKRVIIREDFNVPLEAGKITSDARIEAALPTILQALDAGAKIILLSHLGRPKEGSFSPSKLTSTTGPIICVIFPLFI